MDENGVKVTYIETQFVTSDAASFKSVVQRLTGKFAVAGPVRPLHRPWPCRTRDIAGAGAGDGWSAGFTGSQSYYMPSAGSDITATAANDMRAPAPACVEELNGIRDFSELFYVVGASERQHGGSYDFPC